MRKKLIALGLTLSLLLSLSACGTPEQSGQTASNEDQTAPLEYELTEEGLIKPEIAKQIIAETSDNVLKALSARDTGTIAEFVHPAKGVRFTPYTYVNLEKDIVFTPEKVKNFFQDQKVYLWGHYDGTGDVISLTPNEYYEKFIYSADFLNAEEIGYNEVLSYGNMMENQFEVYQDAIIVEYYFPGFDPKFEGMDWKSLRLVFQEDGSAWKLVGIIHNQWTI